MNQFKFPIKFTDLAGIGTWAMVFGLSLYWLNNQAEGFHPDIPLVSIFFLLYLVCFVLITRNPSVVIVRKWLLIILMAQLGCAFVLLWLLPVSFLPILTIIWVSVLPHLFSIGRSILITLVVVALWFLVYKFHWQQEVFFSALLYSSFHLFSMLMMHHAKTAEDATKEALRLNAELLSTRQLLSEVSKQSERTRIARDLHDLLGHHLTALIINLQIAGHLTEGDAKSKVDQCHSLAKLLMSDVREAVTTLRENKSIDINKMVEMMTGNIPNLKVHNLIDTEIDIEAIPCAKALLSCIQEAMTNTIKHSGASEFWINLSVEGPNFVLTLSDNGQINQQPVHGNGLKGMTERVAELKGSLEIQTLDRSLHLTIKLPVNSEIQFNKHEEILI
ncbi:MAG: hypothetical protein KUG78_11785 [Kangiellaceae bacterium]|nr:hypothetical protein [Kangiellaceae bacterium]